MEKIISEEEKLRKEVIIKVLFIDAIGIKKIIKIDLFLLQNIRNLSKLQK
jgi:hypothetical protein